MFSEVFKLYPDRDDVTLTSYVIADSSETTKKIRRPGILICPGGAYLFCSDREAEPVALRFAAMGYHAFVLRYSVYYEGRSPEADNRSTFEMTLIRTASIRHRCAILPRHSSFSMIMPMPGLSTAAGLPCGFSAGARLRDVFRVLAHAGNHGFFGQPEEKFRPAASILLIR